MIAMRTRITLAGDARRDVGALVAATRVEPGCRAFLCGEDVLAPGAWIVVGEWVDREAFEAHERSAHVAAFKAAVVVVDREPLRVYDVDP